MTNLAKNVLTFEGSQAPADDLAGELANAYSSFDAFQYADAMRSFNAVLRADPDNKEARHGANLVIQKTVPRWHFSMMNDHQRNDAFEAALARVVKDKVVLDVGSGAGLLAMMAARAGAKMVYTCEMNSIVADHAKMIVAANGFNDKIKVIGKKSNDVTVGAGEDMLEKADVLVTETLDSALLGEGMVPIINDAKGRLLVDDPVIIPCGAKMYLTLMEGEEVWHMNHAKSASGFDISMFDALSSDGFYPVRLELFEHKFLTEPVEFCQFDFVNDDLKPRHFDIPLTVKQSGRSHAVAYWLDLYLDDQTMFATTPDNFDSHWKQAVQCFPLPRDLVAGERYVLAIDQGLTRFDFELQRIDQKD